MTLTNKQIEIRKKILDVCYKENFYHIPSALSFCDFYSAIDSQIAKNDALVIAKNTGSVVYKILWNMPLRYANGFHKCIFGTNNYGNTFAISAGIATSEEYEHVYLILSDATIHEGTELETLMYLKEHQFKKTKLNIIIDCNNATCISTTKNFENTLFKLFDTFGIRTHIVDGHNEDQIQHAVTLMAAKNSFPECFIFNTIKGYGISFIQNDPIKWHYKKLDKETYYAAIQELNELQ